MEEVNNATDMSEDHVRTHRSVCTRINYLAQDRPDMLFAAKEVARWMSQRNTMAWELAKRCGRNLLGKPRMVQRFATQPPVETITLKIDSDHAGCLRTRRSTTGIASYHGKHVIKTASTTQRRVRILRSCALHSHSGGHAKHGRRSPT